MSRGPVGIPYVVKVDGSAERYEPLSDDHDEDWLQGVLDKNPALIPIQAVDDRVELPLVSVGREIDTSAGPIDNLYVSGNGYLVIAEVKLWRNPEARRKVVAQVLDYAAQVRKWGYADLESAWKKGGPGRKALYSDVAPPGKSEAEWIDAVTANLERGRMALVVIGDGVRENARDLVDAISGQPQFEFRLALVEMKLFSHPAGTLVVPITTFKTSEVERAIVRIDNTTQEVAVSVDIPAASAQGKASGGRSVLSERAFLETLGAGEEGNSDRRIAERLLEALGSSGLIVDWGTACFMAKLADPLGRGIVGLGYFYKTPLALCYPAWVEGGLREDWGFSEASIEKVMQRFNQLAESYGARWPPARREFQVEFGSLDGLESQFIGELVEIGELIRTLAVD